MPNKNILIHGVTLADGRGDLLYFFTWLKLYFNSTSLAANSEIFFIFNLNLLTDDDTYHSREQVLLSVITDLKAQEPSHPIFTKAGFNIAHNTLIMPKTFILKTSCCAYDVDIDLTHVARQHQINLNLENNNIQAIWVSYGMPNSIYASNKKIKIIPILEFDCNIVSEQEKLGIGKTGAGLGILQDADKINAIENIDITKLIPRLPKYFKKKIFYKQQKHNLLTTPSVFAHLQDSVDPVCLLEVYNSPWSELPTHKCVGFWV